MAGEELSYDEFVVILSDSLGVEASRLHKDTSFLDDLGIDSLSVMNFIIKLEMRYRVKLDVTSVWEIRSVGEAYERFTSLTSSPRAS
jgi:acyl carrier protein